MTKALRWGVTALASMGVVALGTFVGCSSSSSTSNDAGTPDAAGETAPLDAGGETIHETGGETLAETGSETSGEEAGETGDTGGETAGETGPTDTNLHVRVAHLSPDAGAVDFCVIPTPSSGAPVFTGVTPTLASLGIASGISFKTVTGYLSLPANSTGYTVRVVAAGATDCSAELVVGSTYTVPVAPGGTYVTAAAYGLKTTDTAALNFTVKVLVDDTSAPSGDAVARLFHAAAGAPAVDVGNVATNGTSLQIVAWRPVAYGTVATTLGSTAAAAGVTVDTNGYTVLNGAALALVKSLGAVVSTTPATTSPLVVAVSLASTPLAANNVYSAYAILDGGTPQILFCTDTPTPIATTSPTSNCVELPALVAPDAGTDSGS